MGASTLDDGFIPKEKRGLNYKTLMNYGFFVENLIIHSLSAPHKREIPESKENYARPILVPTERNQGAK
jgi:hypothetical protein